MRAKMVPVVVLTTILVFLASNVEDILSWSLLDPLGRGIISKIDAETAAEPGGTVHVVLEASSSQSVYFNSFDGRNWGNWRLITHPSIGGWPPDVAVGASDKVHVVWMGPDQNWHTNAFYARSTDGNSWIGPKAVPESDEKAALVRCRLRWDSLYRREPFMEYHPNCLQ